MTTKKRRTAGELVAQLNADPAFAAKRASEEADRQRRAAELRRAEEPLVAALRDVGFAVNSVWDLVNTATPYPAALPVLLEHLQRPYPGPIREGIARAMAVADARFAWDVLTRLYGAEQDTRAKDGLAVAIAAAADDDMLDDVIALVGDVKQGESRVLLLSALEKSGDPRARAALMKFGTDPELTIEVQRTLKRMKKQRH